MPATCHPFIETLESRCLLASIAVVDGGGAAASLRADDAFTQSNALAAQRADLVGTYAGNLLVRRGTVAGLGTGAGDIVIGADNRIPVVLAISNQTPAGALSGTLAVGDQVFNVTGGFIAPRRALLEVSGNDVTGRFRPRIRLDGDVLRGRFATNFDGDEIVGRLRVVRQPTNVLAPGVFAQDVAFNPFGNAVASPIFDPFGFETGAFARPIGGTFDNFDTFGTPIGGTFDTFGRFGTPIGGTFDTFGTLGTPIGFNRFATGTSFADPLGTVFASPFGTTIPAGAADGTFLGFPTGAADGTIRGFPTGAATGVFNTTPIGGGALAASPATIGPGTTFGTTPVFSTGPFIGGSTLNSGFAGSSLLA